MLLTVIVCVISLAYFYCYKVRRPDWLPPGPRGYPVLGYIPYLQTESNRVFMRLAQKYGPTFGIKLGLNDVIVVNDFKTARLVLMSDNFLDRPRKNIFNTFAPESESMSKKCHL